MTYHYQNSIIHYNTNDTTRIPKKLLPLRKIKKFTGTMTKYIFVLTVFSKHKIKCRNHYLIKDYEFFLNY